MAYNYRYIAQNLYQPLIMSSVCVAGEMIIPLSFSTMQNYIWDLILLKALPNEILSCYI